MEWDFRTVKRSVSLRRLIRRLCLGLMEGQFDAVLGKFGPVLSAIRFRFVVDVVGRVSADSAMEAFDVFTSLSFSFTVARPFYGPLNFQARVKSPFNIAHYATCC